MAGTMEKGWTAFESWLGRLPWWIRAPAWIAGVLAMVLGGSVAGVLRSLLNYDIPEWVPGFVESGWASLVLIAIGVVVMVALILSRPRQVEVAAKVSASPIPISGKRRVTKHEWTEVDEQGEVHQHATVMPDTIRISGGPLSLSMSTGGYKREGIPGWTSKHGLLDGGGLFGLGGIELEAYSTNGDKRRVLRCIVTRDGQPAGIADATVGVFGTKVEDLAEREHDQYAYPQDFAGAPDLPLPNGDYRVEWIAVRDATGEQDLTFDSFRLVNGKLVDDSDASEPFDWTNNHAREVSEPYLRGLLLRLTEIGDRWSRGVICTVRTPHGSEFVSGRLEPHPDSVRVKFPEDFAGAGPIQDGIHTITWRDAIDDEVAATRKIDVREIIARTRKSGRKPGDRFTLDLEHAREMIREGAALYLQDYGFSIEEWSGRPNFSCNECAFSTLKLEDMEAHRRHKH